jgi:LysR family hydrogen peroxide-inducible transcriptional activator
MDIQQLRYFLAVADAGNFTRAAEGSSVSQPALSQQIINLEKEVGHKLLHRLGRRAVLTEAGLTLRDRARRILFEVEDAAKELSDSPSLERRIVVGSIASIAPYLLPDLITRCRSRYPNLQINVHENFRSDLIQEVIEGVLDLALVALPVKGPRLHIEPFLEEPLLLVTGRNHPLASRARVTATDLAQEVFVLLGSSSSLAEQVKSFCGDHNFEPKIGFRCSQIATVKALVAAGAGVSILPRVARAAEDDSSLAYLSLEDAKPVRTLAVVRHLQRYQSRGAEQFLALLRERAGELMAS